MTQFSVTAVVLQLLLASSLAIREQPGNGNVFSIEANSVNTINQEMTINQQMTLFIVEKIHHDKIRIKMVTE